MKRDITKIKRDLENKQNNDIIYKKALLSQMFQEDPDILEVLGQKEKRPLNQYLDKDHPTEEELAKRKEILAYNEKVSRKQIIPYLKLNGLQKEVINFLMFEIEDSDVSLTNNVIKFQTLIVMCLVHEDDMDTEYDIPRTDLLDYLVKDLLCWSNSLGMQLKCTNDYRDIIDSKYYCRTLKFQADTPNHMLHGGVNKYDRF